MAWKECQEQYTQYTELLEEFFDSYESLHNLQKRKFAQALNVPEKKFKI